MSLKLIGDYGPPERLTPPLHRAPLRWAVGDRRRGKWSGSARLQTSSAGRGGDPAGLR